LVAIHSQPTLSRTSAKIGSFVGVATQPPFSLTKYKPLLMPSHAPASPGAKLAMPSFAIAS
jgi:hypothetical protein